MTKISKNIKRLRNSQNISQEALAERLYISRQAVSSWENDRTQPDIEMIGKLAEVFNVSVEELIYGEKRKIEIENEEPKQNNRLLIIIFSILGSAFVAIGLIFFIVFGIVMVSNRVQLLKVCDGIFSNPFPNDTSFNL